MKDKRIAKFPIIGIPVFARINFNYGTAIMLIYNKEHSLLLPSIADVPRRIHNFFDFILSVQVLKVLTKNTVMYSGQQKKSKILL